MHGGANIKTVSCLTSYFDARDQHYSFRSVLRRQAEFGLKKYPPYKKSEFPRPVGRMAEWRMRFCQNRRDQGLRSYRDPARISRPGTSGSTWERIVTYLPFLPATRLFNRHQIRTSARTRRFFPPGDWLHSKTNDQKFPGPKY